MERFFYHGIGNDINCETLDLMLDIMECGILKSRNVVGYIGDEYAHVCLYKKNEEHDYTGSNLNVSAYDGWIYHSFCFIVSPYLIASKTDFFHSLDNETSGCFTDLVDEWRSEGDIPLDRVIGIGLPFDKISEQRSLPGSVVDEFFNDKLTDIILFAEEMDWIIVNSDDTDFADSLDNRLNDLSSNKPLLKK